MIKLKRHLFRLGVDNTNTRRLVFFVCVSLLCFGCDKSSSEYCTTDDDCAEGSLCDFISGDCYNANIEYSEGEFSGDFSCVVGADVISAELGTSTVYGGWNDDLLSLEFLTYCYIDENSGDFILSLGGRRNESDHTYNYLLELRTRTESMTGDVALDITSNSTPTAGDSSAIFARAVYQNGQSINSDAVGDIQSGTWRIDGRPTIGNTVEGSLDVSITGVGASSSFSSKCAPALFQGGYDICQAQTHSTYGDVVAYSWSDAATNSASSLILKFDLWQGLGAPSTSGTYQFETEDESPVTCSTCLTIQDNNQNVLYAPKAGGTYELEEVTAASNAVGSRFAATVDAEMQAIDASTGEPLSDGCEGNLVFSVNVPVEAVK